MNLTWKDVALTAILAALVGVLVLRNHGDMIDKALALLVGPTGVVMLLLGRNLGRKSSDAPKSDAPKS